MEDSRLKDPPGSKPVGPNVFEWQRTLDALRESESRFRALTESAPVVVWMIDPDYRCTYISSYWHQFTGRDPEQDRGFTWVEALHPDDRERAAWNLIEAVRALKPFQGEYRIKRADGEYGWMSDFGAPYFRANGSYAGHIGTHMDITEHRHREDAGRRLQESLLVGQEAERKRLARELHDGVGQRIAMLAVTLSEMEGLSLVTSPTLLEERLRSVRRDVEVLASDIRRLSHNLHPSTVTNLGLVPSLRQLCQEFSEQMHIPIDFAGGDISSSIREDVAVALFRVGQECLTNIAKHSKSRDARVSLTEESGNLLLTITDGGIGFDVSKVRTNPGLGLVSIQERARMIGANLEIRSVFSQGTTVELRVPISRVGV